MKGTNLQRVLPKCQYPVKAVRGVTGAATTQMRMSARAMLQMYMLDLVCRLGLLDQIKDYTLRDCFNVIPDNCEDDHEIASDPRQNDERI